MNTFYELLMPSTILYGIDSFKEVGKQATKLGGKTLIISDPIMEKLGYVEECKNLLNESGLSYVTYLDVDSEPTDVHVKEAIDICSHEKCDHIVAIGGGSCIDTAKAVSVLMTNGGTMTDYFGTGKKLTKEPLPVIAVPTTAGTGSEVTKVTVITDVKTDIKMMLADASLLPAVAIVDPNLTVSCPKGVTAATGVDALCHAIEAYISRKAHPVTDVLALTAIDHIIGSIRTAYEEGTNMDARSSMALGSMLAGAAFSNASVTLVHGMSRPIGALFHTPHGISNAMLLPAVLEFTMEATIDRLAQIGQRIVKNANTYSNRELAIEVINELKQLCFDLDIPNMKTYGIDKELFTSSLSKMAADAIESGSPANTPKIPSADEIIELYQKCYHYDFSEKIQFAQQTN
ncbi:alcohol dehydrogenase [Sporosarcina sp. P12(2017)]|uniref:iron-containing alcohol dehydrogenase n=1 Tax=unclassified Sporosarcina TaxID=2647733 RepID=UPI000C164E45|nr:MULTISPECIES: iron-containing alcohol dehydrogenase [unclassified Sporosarcina]PIC57436.1 alcohol dehydrogenase [Sporosarcina sp. P10]PIC60818.1 alcohol dehydrogenase [Sporosarcina sp. P12(2017)]